MPPAGVHRPEDLRARDDDVVELELEEPPRPVERIELREAQAFAVAGHEQQGDALLADRRSGARGDDEEVGALRVEDEELRAPEPEGVAVAARPERDPGRIEAITLLDPGEGRVDLARGEPWQPELLLLLGGRGEQDARRHQGRGQERGRRERATELDQEDGGVEDLETEPTVLLGNEDTGPTLRREFPRE